MRDNLEGKEEQKFSLIEAHSIPLPYYTIFTMNWPYYAHRLQKVSPKEQPFSTF